MDDNLVFGFPADGGWLYNAPTQWSRRSLPQEIEDVFMNSKVKDVKCIAFGSTQDCYFLSWVNQDSATRFNWGSDCPEEFVEYLKDPSTGALRSASLKVVFGPDKSFFAWDDESIRWSKIPEGLEKCIQSWLGPTGWIRGPPRHVAFGADDVWFASSQYGAWSFHLPNTWVELKRDWTALKFKEICGKGGVSAISFSASHVDRYVVVMTDDYRYCYNVPQPTTNLLTVLDSLAPEEIQKSRKDRRERIKQEQEQERARKESEERARASKQEREAMKEKTALHYPLWKSSYEAAMARDRTLTTFPHLPVPVCTCKIVACVIDKQRDNSLRACQHDVEQLLRASESYSLEWLRRERLLWHPDKFARHCDPDFRRILTGKATELYAIFESLIEAEQQAG